MSFLNQWIKSDPKNAQIFLSIAPAIACLILHFTEAGRPYLFLGMTVCLIHGIFWGEYIASITTDTVIHPNQKGIKVKQTDGASVYYLRTISTEAAASSPVSKYYLVMSLVWAGWIALYTYWLPFKMITSMVVELVSPLIVFALHYHLIGAFIKFYQNPPTIKAKGIPADHVEKEVFVERRRK